MPDHLRALGLAARQCAGGPVERQVAKTDLDERVERLPQRLEQRRHRRLGEVPEPVGQVADLHRGEVDDALVLIFDDRASALSRVPSQSGQVVNAIARSTNARMCGCSASRSLDRNDFRIVGISPAYVRLIPSTLIFVGSLWSRSCSSFLVYLLIGLSGSKKSQPRKMRPYQPSML